MDTQEYPKENIGEIISRINQEKEKRPEPLGNTRHEIFDIMISWDIWDHEIFEIMISWDIWYEGKKNLK